MLTGLAVGYALAHKDTPVIVDWLSSVVPRFAFLAFEALYAAVSAKCSQRKKEFKVPNLSVYASQMNAIDTKLSQWDPTKLENLLDSASGAVAAKDATATDAAADAATDAATVPAVNEYRTPTEIAAAGALLSLKD